MSPPLEEKEEWKIIGVWPKKGRGHGAGEIPAFKIFWFVDKRGMKDFLHTGNRGPRSRGGLWPAGKCPAPHIETLTNKQLLPGTRVRNNRSGKRGARRGDGPDPSAAPPAWRLERVQQPDQKHPQPSDEWAVCFSSRWLDKRSQDVFSLLFFFSLSFFFFF